MFIAIHPSSKSNVYATIAFYLNRQQEVEAYLEQRQQQAREIRKKNEARFDPQGLRDRLLARPRNPAMPPATSVNMIR